MRKKSSVKEIIIYGMVFIFLQLLGNLIENLDPIRQKYWEYIKEKFESSHSTKFDSATTT